MNLGQIVESKSASEITELLNRDRGVFLVNGGGSFWQLTKIADKEVPQTVEQARSASQR